MKTVLRILALGFLPTIWCLPFSENSLDNDVNFIGKGTNEIATALLQGYVEKEDNMVYSPFGYSAILAIFSEAARGASREEIATALHFPKDFEAVRMGYKNILERFVEKKYPNSPEFKNWFYIYKNFTVKEDLQNILRKYYLTEVKYVDRLEDFVKEPKKVPAVKKVEKGERTSPETSQKYTKKYIPEGSKLEEDKYAIKAMLDIENSKVHLECSPSAVPDPTETVSTVATVETTKTKASNSPEVDPKMEENETKDTKFVVKLDEKTVAEKNSEFAGEKNEKEEENAEEEKKTEMMEPLKADVQIGTMPLEHFSGMTDSSIKIKGKEKKSQMIIFNGLYYKGEWKNSFEKKPAHDSRVFYKSEKEKIFVSTIHSQGIFNAGEIPNLDCRAIELPYQGDRYSLLILVPNARDGLTKLISDLSGYPLSGIYGQLSEKFLDVCLPCFEINTISKPISSLRKSGVSNVTSIFKPDTADLSGISTADSGLYVEELVQMVTFKVSAEYAKTNFLTASNAASRSDVHKFQVNQPFLFYLRDTAEDLTIVNGKVVDPTPKPDFYFS